MSSGPNAKDLDELYIQSARECERQQARADALEKRVAELERNAKANKREAGMMIEALFNQDAKLDTERKRADEAAAKLGVVREMCEVRGSMNMAAITIMENILATLDAPVDVLSPANDVLDELAKWAKENTFGHDIAEGVDIDELLAQIERLKV